MFTCKESIRKIAGGELAEATWAERAGVRFHLLMCRHCRRVARQVRAIGETARRAWRDDARDKAALERLERRILEQLPSKKDDTPEPPGESS